MIRPATLAFCCFALSVPALAQTASPPPDGRIHTCEDLYPAVEAQNGIEGSTALHFTITPQGTVADPAVEKSSGNANLDAAALQCVKRWLYAPRQENGKPVPSPWHVRVAWKLPQLARLPYVDTPPACLNSFPVKARTLAGISGITEVEFRLDGDKVTKAVVTKSSGNANLDRAAALCIMHHNFNINLHAARANNEVAWKGMPLIARIDWHDAPKAGD